MAIRQARLKPLALSASCHERMVNGCTAATGGTGTGQARTGQVRHHRLGQTARMSARGDLAGQVQATQPQSGQMVRILTGKSIYFP